MTEIKIAPQGLRPSELEARMVGLREEGVRDYGRSATDRATCDGYVKGAALGFEKVVAEAADKP